jgi:hypothetical protein
MSPTLLDIIENDSMLPQYQQQVRDAKEWGNTVADVKAVIDNAEESQQWRDNVMRNVEQVVENANNRDDIMTNLEKVIDDVQNPQVAQDFEKVLNGLEQLGYQRDATVIESRKQRKEREAENKILNQYTKSLQNASKAEAALGKLHKSPGSGTSGSGASQQRKPREGSLVDMENKLAKMEKDRKEGYDTQPLEEYTRKVTELR